ncbi:MAG: hypothetical protein HFJ30_07525 [Clostridia bacterium]|jgi:hypothetical protein|nr:hypothetical protein [Clostridia bacterium]
MSLIGILTQNQNKAYLKEELEKRGLEDVFFLTESTAQNMRNVRFDMFLLGKKITEEQEMIREIAKRTDYFILNSDVKENLQLLENLDLKIITYGYNQKASVTTSSVEEEKVIVCLQRGIKNIYQEEIEPQEMELEIDKSDNNSAVLELASLLFLYSKKD